MPPIAAGLASALARRRAIELITVPGAGHLLVEEWPEQVAAFALFLDDYGPRRGG